MSALIHVPFRGRRESSVPEILTLVGRALSNREIAETVVLAESTVKTYINRLLRKLSMRDRAGLIVLAYETGLIRPGQDE